MSVFWLVLSMAIWGVVHSWLASLQVKSMLGRILGARAMRFYRLGYNAFAFLSFLPIVWLMIILQDRPLYRVPVPWNGVMLLGQGIAVLLLLVGVMQTGLGEFIGVSQLVQPEQQPVLKTDGLYRLVRHPLYSAGMLFLWLTPAMTVNLFSVYLAGSLYFILGAVFEERKLLREFGSQYAEYRQRTPMFIPGVIPHPS